MSGSAGDPFDRWRQLGCIVRVSNLNAVVEDHSVGVVDELRLIAELDRFAQPALADWAGIDIMHASWGVCVPRWLPTQGSRSRCGATHPVIAMSVSSRERRIPADPGVQDRLVRSYRPRTDRGQHRSTPGRRLPPARHPGGRGRAHQPDSAEQYRHRIRTTDHARSPPPTINRRHERRHLRTQPTARRGVERPQDVHRSTAHVAGIVGCWAAPTLELRN